MGDGGEDASSKSVPQDQKALSKKIEELKAKQAAMLAERKRVTKDLRNAEKRRKRLKTNARRLSDEDLAEVMRMREHTKRNGEGQSSLSSTSASCGKKKGKAEKEHAGEK